MSKTEQIDLLNKSLQYFKENDTFELGDFTRNVISKPEIVDKFNDYKRSYESSNDIDIDGEFIVNKDVTKKQLRSYRRAITLDRKIQIIINGNSNQIERGVDSNGKFYKIYYSSEE